MRTENDFKAIWNKVGSNEIPDINALLKKAGNLRKAARIRLIIQSLVLSGAIAIMLIVGFNIENRTTTTSIGLMLMILAMVAYLITSNQLLPMLFKSDNEITSKEFLNQLIRIKRKNDFLDKVMVHIYFSLLFIGMFLYLLQFFMNLSIIKAVFCSITFICLALAWYYSKTRKFRKMQISLNDTIKRLEAVKEQLHDTD